MTSPSVEEVRSLYSKAEASFFALGSIPKTGGEVPHFLSPTRAVIHLASPETQKWVNSRAAALDFSAAVWV